MELVTVEGGPHPAVLLGVCIGLEGEAGAVRAAIGELEPATVALGVDPGLLDHLGELEGDGDLSPEDEAYVRGLARFGEVALPGDELSGALEAGREAGARVEGIDLDEMAYLDRYTGEISIGAMVRRGWRARRLRRRPLKAERPEAFCRAFDARVNKGPFRGLEAAREREMARCLLDLLETGPAVAVVEIARLDGLIRALEEAVGPEARVRRAPSGGA